MPLEPFQVNQDESFVSRFRQNATDLLADFDHYVALKEEYDNTYSVSGRLPDESFVGGNEGLVKDDIVNGKDSINALAAVFVTTPNYRLALEKLRYPL